jgi:hypothetical protein
MPLDLEGSWGGGGGGGGSVGVAARLTPTLFAPFAQWALLGEEPPPGNIPGTDRSGNNRHLSNAFAYAIDDIIPGELSGYAMESSALGWEASGLISAPFVMSACTVTARIRTPRTLLGEDAVILSLGGTGGAGERISLDFYVLRTDGRLRVYWQQESGASSAFASTLAVNDGHWHFVSLRRTAGFVVTLGRDGVYETSAALAAPGAAANPRLTITYQNGGFRRWLGQIADVSFWDSVLTDAQVNALGAVAMGTQYARFQL